ncbi:MAG: FtsX-like permease family protein, partial [Gemmatimonadetes bacterium]
LRSPFVTAVAVISLALGIGANAAIFSLFDQFLIASLPVDEPERLVNLAAPGPKPGSQSCNDAGDCDEVFSYPMFRDLEADGAGFAGLAGHRLFGVNLATGDRTTAGRGLYVSGSYFNLLGVRPAVGRLLTPDDDDQPGVHPVAVLGYRYWERELGADRGVLNGTIVVNGTPMTVVGVAERGFEGTTRGAVPDVYVPLSMRAALESGFTPEDFDERRSYWVYVFARLRPGAELAPTVEQANALYQSIVREVEAPLQQGLSEATLARFLDKPLLASPGRRGQSSLNREARTPLMLLMGITGMVLLIACANIANLLLVRGQARAPELAIRGSLGATRGQMIGQLLRESVVLAALGGLAALLVAEWTLDLIGSFFPPEDLQMMDLSMRPMVFVATGVLALATGVLFGLYPALD